MLSVAACSYHAKHTRNHGIRTYGDLHNTFSFRYYQAVCKAKVQSTIEVSTHSTVPLTFDPFRAWWIAPDHLLGGIFRNIMPATTSFLPSERAREQFVDSVANIARSVKIPYHHIRSTHTTDFMNYSMTEIFAIGEIFPIALIRAIRA